MAPRFALAAISHRLSTVACTVAVALTGHAALGARTPDAADGFPPRLADTGLPLHGASSAPHPPPAPSARGPRRAPSHGLEVLPFSPQYPLWSDGTDKRRWIHVPRGRRIDASDPDAWQFPPGTKLWKEFAYAGRPVETRLIERRADGRWHFAAYVWSDDGRSATLAPAEGAVLDVPAAPGGRYRVPARQDCIACHGSARVPVLGFGALQLSPDRDPVFAARATGGIDLRDLVARQMLHGLPASLLEQPPRVAGATPLERAALGYLHGNCAHCHNASGQRAPVRLMLEQSVADPKGSHAAVLASMVRAPARYRPHGAPADPQLVVPGHETSSVLLDRMRTRDPRVRMPPLGTEVPDPEGLALVTRWILEDLPTRQE